MADFPFMKNFFIRGLFSEMRSIKPPTRRNRLMRRLPHDEWKVIALWAVIGSHYLLNEITCFITGVDVDGLLTLLTCPRPSRSLRMRYHLHDISLLYVPISSN
jgi:hypothetical protein